MYKLIIIEDDRAIVELINIHMDDVNASLAVAYDGITGLKMVKEGQYDLLILDLTLPGLNGLDICQKIRSFGNQIPILMLTAKTEEIDKVLGLETGADDYLTKPFGVRELLARIRALLRRSSNTIIQNKLRVIQRDNLCVDMHKRKVTINDKRIHLSKKEFDLLALLAANPGKSYSRSDLLQTVWGYDFDGYEHTVNSHINRLRTKIEPEASAPKFILTSWGVGYRFNEDI